MQERESGYEVGVALTDVVTVVVRDKALLVDRPRPFQSRVSALGILRLRIGLMVNKRFDGLFV